MTRSDPTDRYLLVTSDAHAGAAMADYKAFLDPHWHDEFDAWLVGVVMPWVDVRDTSNWDSEVRLAQMDADGVSAEIIFPNTLPPFFDILAHLSGVPRDRATFDRKWAGLQAHNRWLVDFCEQAPLRRRGIVQLLPNDLDVAIAELRWAESTGAVAGVMLPAVPANHVVEPYFHERYDPLWAACVETGLPVHQHQGTGAPDVGTDPIATTIFFTELELWTKRTLHHLVVGGVFERHPELQVLVLECGGGWIAHWMDRFDEFLEAYDWALPAPLSLTPSEYFRRNCVISFDPGERTMGAMADLAGEDNLIWASDFPHSDAKYPGVVDELLEHVEHLPGGRQRKIVGENAARIYRIQDRYEKRAARA